MSLWAWLKSIFGVSGIERPSPSDIIPTTYLSPYNYPKIQDKITFATTGLQVPLTMPPKVWMPSVPDTGSMDGVIDFGHHSILIQGQNADEQKNLAEWVFEQPVGNVIVIRDPPEENIPSKWFALHRIIKKGTDDLGAYIITRGDNNTINDPGKWRLDNFKWLVIGFLY